MFTTTTATTTWCLYDRCFDNDHCYTMSLQPQTRLHADSEMVDASGLTLMANLAADQRATTPSMCTTGSTAVSSTVTNTVTTSASQLSSSNSDAFRDNIQELKRSLTLDFNNATSVRKSMPSTPELLSLLRFTSPELEKFLTQAAAFAATPNNLVTSTPTPTSFFYPKNVTSEQEQYARGFIDALNQIHLLRGPCIPMTSLLSPGFVATTIQQQSDNKDDLNKFRDSTVSVEQLFRTLTANAIWTPGGTPFNPTTPMDTSTSSSASSTVVSSGSHAMAGNAAHQPPKAASVIFPSTTLANHFSVISRNAGGANMGALDSFLLQKHQESQSAAGQEKSQAMSPSCTSPPNSASCSSAQSADDDYTPPPTQVLPLHSSSTSTMNCTAATFAAGMIVPSSMLPTAQYITLPSACHSPRATSSNSSVHNDHTIGGRFSGGSTVKIEVDGRQLGQKRKNSRSAKNSSISTTNYQSSSSTTSSTSPNFVAGISVSPMDPMSQERMKLERKRARNRVAATKCRKRKIEKIVNLDEKVKEVIKQNDEIEEKISVCKEEVARLRLLVKEHQLRGCNVKMI